MSDYDDDMDLDGPKKDEGITFSSDNTNAKGKRSAANLPVEAEDNLPWYIYHLCQPTSLTDSCQGGKVQTRDP